MIAALVLGSTALFLPTQESLAQRLAQAVDLPTPSERAVAARKLARDRTVELDAWLAAMRSFGEFEALDPGRHDATASLVVSDDTVATPIAFRIPSGYDPEQPAPLLIALHGTGGSGRGLDGEWQVAAEALGMIVVAPSETGSNQGYEYTRRERQTVLATLRWARRRFNVDERRIFLTGISRGGHLTWDVALRYPDRWAALAPMIGGPRLTIENGQNNLRFLESLVATPIRDLQGERDHPLLLFNLNVAFERLAQFGARDAELVTFPSLGHSYEFSAVDWTAFLAACERDPAPARLVHRCASEPYGRNAWIEVLDLDRGATEEFRPKVDAQTWNRLDDEGRSRFMLAEAEQRTARVAAHRTAVGRFEIETELVKKFRLLLRTEDFDPQKSVVAQVNGKSKKKRLRPDVEVLLTEFVERFDRTFLPVAEFVLR